MIAEKPNNNDKPPSPTEKFKPTLPRYKVMVDDNFHFMDEDERWHYGDFLTAEEAIATCKSIVDSNLENSFKPGMTATKLLELYSLFGDDPFIVCVDPADEPVRFSAWSYANERSQAITSHDKI